MKKEFLTLFSVALCVASCSNEEIINENESTIAAGDMAVEVVDLETVSLNDANTRTTIGFSVNVSMWTGSETIGILPLTKGSSQVPFTVTTSGVCASPTNTPTTEATTSSSSIKKGQGFNFAAYYPYNSSLSRTGNYSAVPLDFTNLFADSPSTSALYNPGWDYMYAKDFEYSYQGKLRMTFKKVYGMINVVLYNTPQKSWRSVVLKTRDGSKTFVTKGTLDLYTGNTTATAYASTLTQIHRTSATSKGASVMAYFPTLPTTTGDMICEFIATDGTKYRRPIESIKVEAGKCYTYSIDANEIDRERAEDKLFPSLSVVWATCNVGASKPYELGRLFAWGQVGNTWSYEDNINKYNKDYQTLSLADDAAHRIMGKGWRMPTKAEYDELLRHHICDEVDYPGTDVRCYHLYVDNSNLYFPSVPCHPDHPFPVVRYWTSTNNTATGSDPNLAIATDWSAGRRQYWSAPRSEQLYIRAVRDKH